MTIKEALDPGISSGKYYVTGLAGSVNVVVAGPFGDQDMAEKVAKLCPLWRAVKGSAIGAFVEAKDDSAVATSTVWANLSEPVLRYTCLDHANAAAAALSGVQKRKVLTNGAQFVVVVDKDAKDLKKVGYDDVTAEPETVDIAQIAEAIDRQLEAAGSAKTEAGAIQFPVDRWKEVAVGARVDFKVGHKRYFAKLEPDLESSDPENTFAITIELVTMSPAGGKPEQTEHVDFLGEIDGRDAEYLNGLLADMLKQKGLSGAVTEAAGEKLVSTFENGDRVAKVYKDTEWDTHRVKFFVGGKHQTEADSEDDKQGCIDTAKSWVKQAKEAGNIANLAPKFAKKGGKDDKDKDGKSDKDEKDKTKGKKPWEESREDKDETNAEWQSRVLAAEPEAKFSPAQRTAGTDRYSQSAALPDGAHVGDWTGDETTGQGTYYPEASSVEADIDRALGEARDIDIWVVTKPTPDSELVDILFASSVRGMERQYRGGLTQDEVVEIFPIEQEAEAKALADRLLKGGVKAESLVRQEAKLDRAQIDSLWAKFEECDKVTQEAGDGVTIGQRQKRSRAFNEFKRACAYMNLDPAKEAVEYMKKGSLAKIAEDGELDDPSMVDPAMQMEDPSASVDSDIESMVDEGNSMGLIDAAKDHLGVDFAMKTSFENDVKVTSITPKASPQQGAVEAFAQAVQALGLDAEYDGDTGSFRVTQTLKGEAVAEEAVFESKKY